MKYVKRSKGMIYESNPAGVRELGTSSIMTNAALEVARRVSTAANGIDSKGNYSTRGISTTAGHANEPRNGAVVEGDWYPGAGSRSLLSAIESLKEKRK